MSNTDKTAFVIAHFHENGRVALNTHALVEEMAKFSKSIVFVSTNLNEFEANRLKKHAQVIQRENTGYDFWSYKLGIEQLGDISQFDRIVVCNTSFISLDPSFLVQSFTGPIDQVGLRGLTRCGEMGEHIQSYWISFEGNQLLMAPKFIDWWNGMLPLNDRNENINQYEVGISRYFSSHGYSLTTLFQETANQLLIMLARAISRGSVYFHLENTLQIVPLDLKYALDLNPTIFGWDFILDQLKILKVEQVKFNYGHQYLDLILSSLSQDEIALINDAII
jgi:lipopolysaccharide biosynthesis protein